MCCACVHWHVCILSLTNNHLVICRLGSLLFGEGVLNDALSIALFQALHAEFRRDGYGENAVDIVMRNHDHARDTVTKDLTDLEDIGPGLSLALLAKQVLFQSLISAAIGAVCGLLNARIFKIFPSMRSFPIHQTSLVLLFGYLSYALAELCGVSGESFAEKPTRKANYSLTNHT